MEYSLKNQWIPCPACGGNTRTKVREDTVLYHQPLFCPKCKREYPVNVKQFKTQIVSSQTLRRRATVTDVNRVLRFLLWRRGKCTHLCGNQGRFYMNKEWSQRNKEIQVLLGKEATYKEGIQKLISFREELFEQISNIDNSSW